MGGIVRIDKGQLGEESASRRDCFPHSVVGTSRPRSNTAVWRQQMAYQHDGAVPDLDDGRHGPIEPVRAVAALCQQ